MNSRRILFVAGAVALLCGGGWWLSLPLATSGKSSALVADSASGAMAANVNSTTYAVALVARVERIPQAAEVSERPVRMATQVGGALRFIGIEPGWRLPSGVSHVVGKPAETARNFIMANREAFGLANPRVDVVAFDSLPGNGRTAVRLQQTYGSLPILGAESVVQVGDSGDIVAVLADFSANIASLDSLALPIVPTVSESDATRRAGEILRGQLKRGPVKSESAKLIIYAPEVLGFTGTPSIAWDVRVLSPGVPVRASGRAIIDAESGVLLNYLDEICTSVNRRMYDDNNSLTTDTTTVVRTEGGPAAGVAQVDNCYDFIGHTWFYYLAVHGRDSYDGAGGIIHTFVRDQPNQVAGQPVPASPWPNASASGNVLRFGDGYQTDDVVAHEFTHLVTENTSRLFYQNASGAINECFSDIWGEAVDFSNTGGTPATNDAAAVRWQVGEDIPGGAIRNMKNPPAFSNPDRISSSLYTAQVPLPNGGAGGNDAGGVHNNSGVGNKLCYLLTDGDTFNGQTITGEGMTNVVNLFYEVQTSMLTPASDWLDLYFALTQAAQNQGWNATRRNNLFRACIAVEIAGASHDFFVDRSSPAQTTDDPPQPIMEVGIPNPAGTYGPYRSLQAGLNAVNNGGTLNLRGGVGNYNASPDGGGPVTISKPVTLRVYNAPVTITP